MLGRYENGACRRKPPIDEWDFDMEGDDSQPKRGMGRGHRHGRTDESSEKGGHRHGWGRRHRHGKGRGKGGGRLFDYGELRLLILSMIAQEPRHGYELIKEIEDRSGGSYVPSPGVIYPTLTWLDDMGYAEVELMGGNRKLYRLTQEGEDFLNANADLVKDLLDRIAQAGDKGPGGAPSPILRGMENLKTALRLRMRQGSMDEATARAIADILDDAAKKVEQQS